MMNAEEKTRQKILLLEAGCEGPALCAALEASGFTVDYARTTGRGLSLLERRQEWAASPTASAQYDAVVVAQWMPDEGTPLLIPVVRDRLPEALIILLAEENLPLNSVLARKVDATLTINASLASRLSTILHRLLPGNGHRPAASVSVDEIHWREMARELLRQELRLRVMDRVNRLMISAGDGETAIRDSVRLVQEVFQFHSCAVYLPDWQRNEIRRIAGSGQLNELAEIDMWQWLAAGTEYPNPVSETAGKPLPVFPDDLFQPEKLQPLASGNEDRNSAEIVAALWQGEEIIGLLKVELSRADMMDEFARETVELFGRQLSLALQSVPGLRQSEKSSEQYSVSAVHARGAVSGWENRAY